MFLLALLVSVCDMCLSGDKSVLCDKQGVVMRSLQAPVSPRIQDSQEQLYSPGNSRQTRIPEFYLLILFGFSSEEAVLYTGIYMEERGWLGIQSLWEVNGRGLCRRITYMDLRANLVSFL